MEAELYKELNEKDRLAVKALVLECNHADHTDYDPDLDGDFYYIIRNDDKEESGVESDLFAVLTAYLLGETIDGRQILEIEAFTHPMMRGIGFFSTCFNSLKDDFRDYRYRFMIKSPLSGNYDTARQHLSFDSDEKDDVPVEADDYTENYFPDSAASVPEDHTEVYDDAILKPGIPFVSPDTYKTLCALDAVHQYDELFMEKVLKSPISNPGDELCSTYGEVHLTEYNHDTLYLYGLLVYDKYLRKGCGRRIMESIESYENGPYKKILLQVSTQNPIACHLYRKLGYKEIERIVYFTVIQ